MKNRLCAIIMSFLIVFSTITYACAADGTAPAEKFDRNLGLYTETFAGGRQFVSTVPNNGRTYDAVILDLPQGIEAQLRRDGNIVAVQDNEPVYETGYYTLHIYASDVLSGESTDTLFAFRIMGTPATGTLINKRFGCPEIACAASPVQDSETSGMYIYEFPNHKRFYSSVPESSAEVDRAVFVFPPNVGYELYKNGQPSSPGRDMTVTQPGSYSMNVYAKNYGVAPGYSAVYKATVSFTIPSPEAAAAAQPSGLISSAVSAVAPQLGLSTPVSSPAAPTADNSPVVQAQTTVEKDSLVETYREEAEIYKEEFSSGDAFYTNTANGTICGGNVYIDIPANMTVEMTKDGRAVQFANRTYLNEPGSYTLNITDIYGTRMYGAKYTFRIQPGLDSSESAEGEITDDESGDEGEYDVDFGSFEGADYGFDTVRERFVYYLGDKMIYMNIPPGMFSNDGLTIDLPNDVSAEAVDENGDVYTIENGEINENGSYTVTLSGSSGGKAELKFYLYNRAVNMPEEYEAPKGYLITGIEYSDYKNTYGMSDDEADEDDFYLMDSGLVDENEENGDGEDTEETSEDEETLELRREYEEGLDTIDKLADIAASGGIYTLVMPIDGRYDITMRGEEGMPVLHTEILVDRTVPTVYFDGLNEKNVSVGNEFTLSCPEDDVTLVLYKGKEDGDILSEEGGAYTVKGVGKYTISAIDAAGNESTYDVKISRHIGLAGVGTIVLLVVLLAAVAGFIAYNSRKFSVR